MCIYLYPAASFLVGRSVFPCANSHPLRRRGPPSRKTPPNTPRSTGRSLVIIWAPCIWEAVIPPSFLRTPTVRRCRSLDWQSFFSCPLGSRVSDEKCAIFLLSVPLGQCVSSHRLLLVFSSSRVERFGRYAPCHSFLRASYARGSSTILSLGVNGLYQVWLGTVMSANVFSAPLSSLLQGPPVHVHWVAAHSSLVGCPHT